MLLIEQSCSADAQQRRTALQALGIASGTKAEAESQLTVLGRSGQMPWCLPHVQKILTYIDGGAVMLACAVHGLTHGMSKLLLGFGLKSGPKDVPDPTS